MWLNDSIDQKEHALSITDRANPSMGRSGYGKMKEVCFHWGDWSMRPWYKESFGEDYLLVYKHRNRVHADREVTAIIDWLDLTPEDQILDLCCGTGRHAIELARRGMSVIGMDLSDVLLHHAREDSQGLDIDYVQGDMRSLPFASDSFDVVLNLFTSFGYFVDDGENSQVLAEIARILKPEGRFVIDYLNREAVKKSLVPLSEREEEGISIREERKLDGDFVRKTITISEAGTKRRYHERVKMYTREEMEELLEKAGLTVEQVWGDYQGQPYTIHSPRMILTGRRAG